MCSCRKKTPLLHLPSVALRGVITLLDGVDSRSTETVFFLVSVSKWRQDSPFFLSVLQIMNLDECSHYLLDFEHPKCFIVVYFKFIVGYSLQVILSDLLVIITFDLPQG